MIIDIIGVESDVIIRPPAAQPPACPHLPGQASSNAQHLPDTAENDCPRVAWNQGWTRVMHQKKLKILFCTFLYFFNFFLTFLTFLQKSKKKYFQLFLMWDSLCSCGNWWMCEMGSHKHRMQDIWVPSTRVTAPWPVLHHLPVESEKSAHGS